MLLAEVVKRVQSACDAIESERVLYRFGNGARFSGRSRIPSEKEGRARNILPEIGGYIRRNLGDVQEAVYASRSPLSRVRRGRVYQFHYRRNLKHEKITYARAANSDYALSQPCVFDGVRKKQNAMELLTEKRKWTDFHPVYRILGEKDQNYFFFACRTRSSFFKPRSFGYRLMASSPIAFIFFAKRV